MKTIPWLWTTLSLLLLCPTLQAQTQWTWKNPLPQGNGLNGGIALDAQNYIAVGAAGTIIKTSDQGASWRKIPSGTQSYLWGLHLPTTALGVAVGEPGAILRAPMFLMNPPLSRVRAGAES